MNPISLTDRPAWQALQAHYQQIKDAHLRDLFRDDPDRGRRLSLKGGGLYMDYSKHHITDETLGLLIDLARECGLAERRQAMFDGQKINRTEMRAVLHTALRAPKDAHIFVDGVDVVPDVQRVLEKMAGFADRVRDGTWTGHTGQRIRNVINIGIGGSDLGPVMAYEALRVYADRAPGPPLLSNGGGPR